MDNWKITIWALLFLLGGTALKGWAQDDRLARAERIYEHLVEGRGDSIYAALNDEAQRQLSPAVFADTWRQLTGQFVGWSLDAGSRAGRGAVPPRPDLRTLPPAPARGLRRRRAAEHHPRGARPRTCRSACRGLRPHPRGARPRTCRSACRGLRPHADGRARHRGGDRRLPPARHADPARATPWW